MVAAASAGGAALRPLLARLWQAYGIRHHRTNDVGGVSRQLRNLVDRAEVRSLPWREEVEGILAALAQALATPGTERPRIELEMVASLPDLRARHRAQVERESHGSGATYLEDVELGASLSCDALRKAAARRLAE